MQYKLFENSLNDKYQIIETVLLNRGIEDPHEYLNLNESCCNDYNNLENINEAVELFISHFESGDDIAVLVDCDPDGYTSAALIYNYIKELDEDYPVHYIIHNNNKSHGLAKMDDGDFELPKNTKLFIIPDAGVNDIQELNALVDRGIDCICLDHHQKEESDIECKAIIVNNQMSKNYTDKDFAGVGISYEFAKALDDTFVCDLANKYLDLVAFGNISDVMSIKNCQTRYYIEQGMKHINNKFLKALDKAQQFSTKGEINIHNISWYWTPICNSMIRIGSYEDRDLLFRAFIETDEMFPYKKRGSTETIEEDIYTRAARLCRNTKSKQDKMRDALCEELKGQVNPEDKVTLLVTETGDSGIIGLSCMKLADIIGKPCIVLKDIGDGKLSGSARNCRSSIVKDLKEFVSSVGVFDWQMGHSGAFGCQLSADKLDAAREALNKALSNYEYDDTIYCDFILDAYDMDYEFIKTIDDYKWVWGQQVEEPIVAIENIEISKDDCIVMGKNQDTVAFMYGGVKYCKFKCSEDDELLMFARGLSDEYATLNVVGKCSINEYKGNYTAQVIIDDYEFTI